MRIYIINGMKQVHCGFSHVLAIQTVARRVTKQQSRLLIKTCKHKIILCDALMRCVGAAPPPRNNNEKQYFVIRAGDSMA